MKNALIVTLLLIVLFLGSLLASTQRQLQSVKNEYEHVFTRMAELSREEGTLLEQNAKLKSRCAVANAVAGLLGLP